MIITQTPLRISFLGGNTDFPEYFKKHTGRVLTTAIDKYVYCIVKKRFDDAIYLNYSIKECVKRLSQLKHDLVREAMKLVGAEKGIEITFLSDIPSEGSGLGSSSSVLVGVLNALHHYGGEAVSAEQLAQEACKIEIGILKRPIGIQDQYIAAYGGLREFVFKDNEVKTTLISVSDSTRDDLNNRLMLFYTGQTRNSSKILSQMKFDEKILEQNKWLAQQGFFALSEGNIHRFGELLDKYWKLKKKLNGLVSTPQIDRMYTKAKRAGAIGGKIAGAGSGGFMLLMVPEHARNKVRCALKNYREMPFRLAREGSKVIFDNGI